MPKAKKALPAKTVKSQNAAIALRISDDIPYYYLNHVEISQSPHEFAITGARIPARPTGVQMQELGATGKITLDPTVQILFPVELAPGLITALQTQVEIYERHYNKKLQSK